MTQNSYGKNVRKSNRFSSGNTLSGKIVCGICGRVENVKHKCTARTLTQKTIVEEIIQQINIVDLHLDFLPQSVKQIVVENRHLHVILREIDTEKKSEQLHLQDHWLCRHFLDGDKRAGEILVCLHQPLLKKRLYFLQRASFLTREDIEDLEQTVWLRAFSQMKSYNSRYRFWTWLKQIVRSVFNQTMQQKKKHLPATIFAEPYFQSSALSHNIDGWISDEYVNFLLADLADWEYKIVTRYLLAGDTQRSLAKEMELSKSRINQIYLEALENIREKVLEK